MKRFLSSLLLLPFLAFGQSTVTVPTSGTIATENWVKEYLFEQLEKYAVSDCSLKAVDIVQEGTSLEFTLTGTPEGLNTYSVRITKDGQLPLYWNDIPYQAGERLRIEGVPSLDSVRVTVRPTLRPTCYYAFGYNLGGGGNPDPDPDPPVNACTQGPRIESIYNITSIGLTTQFHGINITQIKWTVKTQSGTTVRTGQINPTSSILNLGFSSPVAAGTYILRLEGINCTGFNEQTFTLSGGGGGADPPPSGSIVAKVVTQGLPEHMDISFSGSGTSRTFTDNANFAAPSGYEFRYYINNKLVKTPTRLVNYPWPSNTPLTIYKFQVRPDVTNLYSWGYDEGWKDPNAGATFSRNVTAAYSMFVFEEENSGYNPSTQTVQWQDYLPDAPATDGKFWVSDIGDLSTPTQLIAKGLTTFSNYAIDHLSTQQKSALMDAGRTYDEAVKTPSQLLLPDRGSGQWVPPGVGWPNNWNTQFFDYTPGQTQPLTVQQGFDKGNQYPVSHRIIVFENMENVHAIGTHWPFWTPYYQNLTARMQQRFPNTWRIAHNYFTGALSSYTPGQTSKITQYGQTPGILEYISRAQAKAFLSAPISEWPASNILPGGNMETVNMACFPIYLNSPDGYANTLYSLLYSSYLTHKANKYEAVFMQTVPEWHPNNLKQVNYPEGKFYYYEKFPHGFVDCFNYAFASRTFADGFIPFGAAGKTNGDWRFAKEYHGNALWFPNGSTTPADNNTFTHWTTPDNYQYPSNGFEDAVARGMYAYSQTFMQVSGGSKQFLRYRLDGGAWVEPQNSNYYDLVDAFHDKRGITYAEIKNGKMAVLYVNPYADEANHTLEYQYNGTTYTMTVASTIIHSKLHNL